ncbi:MAG TPA: pyridoxal phosphate-dependent aminotransferase [Aestuariivirga sp.]|nr:pyridoxal phosphate-dependent aminotransferase [Aestuariivirga sp.]
MHPPFTPLVENLSATVPFVGPETLERQSGQRFRARIGANENVFGPSPKAIAAMQAAASEVWQYCDPEIHDLKQALAIHYAIRPENIAIGEGIDGLFGLAVRLFVEPGVTVATSLGAYPTFNFHVHGFGGKLVTTPYVNDREDPEALLELARRASARLIYFANPDNPMGSWWNANDVVRMIGALPPHALLLLDEAYGEFAPEGTLPPIDIENPNVLRFRTFSKAYGMAGMRVGYAIGQRDVIEAFDKIRNHFGVTRLGQQAATAALGDQAHLHHVIEQVAAGRREIARIATANGLVSLPSASNFVSIDCGRDGGYAKRVLNGLLGRGVFVRMPGVAPLNRCIRVTVGTDTDLSILAAELPAALKAAG